MRPGEGSAPIRATVADLSLPDTLKLRRPVQRLNSARRSAAGLGIVGRCAAKTAPNR